jgi:PAS domain S-box-containing protein
MSKDHKGPTRGDTRGPLANDPLASLSDAEAVLNELASVFLSDGAPARVLEISAGGRSGRRHAAGATPKPDDMYRVLVEQIPALVFIAYLDRGISEAYVSPQIESALGFSQAEWLEDPIRWYEHIHPDDKLRWSEDAARLFVTGEPLKSAYRVIARDRRVVWFQCEARMVRKDDGRPWFLHGVGFDISGLKQTEEALQERTSALQNLSSHLLRVQDEERRKIARELHDSLGQYLMALKLNLDLMSRFSGEKREELLCEAQQIAARCLNETRTLSHLLHPPLLDEIGFVEAARWYAEGFARRSEVAITLDLPEKLPRLPDAVEVTLFRVLQESLTNIHRHSGSKTAEIRLGMDGKHICLKIRDQGRGMPPELLERFQKTGAGSGVGLSGMRERVHELAGRLVISSEGEGTLVSVSLPVPGTQGFQAP